LAGKSGLGARFDAIYKNVADGGGRNSSNRTTVNYPELARPTDLTPANIILGDLDELGRPTGVTSVIKTSSIGTGSKANPAIRPPGFEGGWQAPSILDT
jgi:hypothetical protein